MPDSIPQTQTAAVVISKDEDIQIRHDFPVKQPDDLAPGECLIKIEATGVCHSDLHARLDDWPNHPKLPLVGGHEGVGRIVAIGQHTSNSPVKLGDRVGIKWLANSCLHCEHCCKGREINCPQAKASGFTVDGTFQEYAVSYVNHVTLIPEGISSEAAASVLCAGVTVYRALKHSGAEHGDWVVLPGAGGGLGHLAVQYARARGLRVVAVDTGEAKKELVMKLGAEVWIDFKETEDMVKAIKEATGGGPHVALITATSTAAYQQAVDYLRPGGRLMAVSLPPKATIDASVYSIVNKNIIIYGSAVGNRQDAREAIDIAARKEVKVIYDLKGLSDLKDVYQRLEEGKVAGRIVLDMKK